MLQIKNRSLLPNVPFDDYLLLPGWSHSKIKSLGKEFKTPTRRMNLGTLVHQYILEPEKYDHSHQELVKPLAVAIKSRVGSLAKYVTPEIVVTCDMCYNGFVLKYQGRIDWLIIDKMVLDIKVSDMPLSKSIPYFDYDNAMSGYALASNANLALIIRISPKSIEKNPDAPLIEVASVPIRSEWWMNQVVSKGVPQI